MIFFWGKRAFRFKVFVWFFGFFSWLGACFFPPLDRQICSWALSLQGLGLGQFHNQKAQKNSSKMNLQKLEGNGKLLWKAFSKQNYNTLLPQEGACKLITGHFRDFHSENVLVALKCSLQKRQIRYSDRFWRQKRLYIHLLLSVQLKFIFTRILWVTTFREVSWKKNNLCIQTLILSFLQQISTTACLHLMEHNKKENASIKHREELNDVL